MSEKTVRLFDLEPETRAFDAVVLACEAAKDGGFDVVLDRTAFFPEGGGQGADHGTLGEARVLDAHETAGVIRHRTDKPLAVGARVRGVVDPARRLAMSQQHTGEHILSGLVHGLYGYDNVGFHIGSDAVTVDFNGVLTPEDVDRVERLANECVWRNQPVRVSVPDPETLAHTVYRSKKALEGDVRIVTIDGVDCCACCGTHVPFTGQVGQIKVLSCIHYKGGVRLSILCGMRALAYENALLRENRAVSQALSAKPGTLAEAVERLKRERDDALYRLEAAAVAEFAHLAEAESGKAVRVVRADRLPAAQLRKAAGRLAEGARLALVLIGKKEGGWQFALSGSQDVRPAAKALCARFGGKGGGPADMVQGTLAGGEPEEMRKVLEGPV